MFANLQQINYYYIVPIIIILIALVTFIIIKRRRDTRPPLEIEEIFKMVEAAGYRYDNKQDLFYSGINVWQRDMGYCRLYDEAAAPLSMIIDCEPIYFEYDNKKWLIQFWKGQYGMTVGGEIGVYNTINSELNIPGIFNGTFYYCAEDEDLLTMEFTLFKNRKALFTRKDIHWWLTGFVLGEFAHPHELKMDLKITLKDIAMRDAFIKGLENAGYADQDIVVGKRTVSLLFNKPKTEQPRSRIDKVDRLSQQKNKELCNIYQRVAGDYEYFPEQIMAVQEFAPEIFDLALELGVNKHLFDNFASLQKYLPQKN